MIPYYRYLVQTDKKVEVSSVDLICRGISKKRMGGWTFLMFSNNFDIDYGIEILNEVCQNLIPIDYDSSVTYQVSNRISFKGWTSYQSHIDLSAAELYLSNNVHINLIGVAQYRDIMSVNSYFTEAIQTKQTPNIESPIHRLRYLWNNNINTEANIDEIQKGFFSRRDPSSHYFTWSNFSGREIRSGIRTILNREFKFIEISFVRDP